MPVAFAASGAGYERRPEHPLLAPLIDRLQEQRRPLRPPVDGRRWRAARRRRSGRRTGCSDGTAARRAAFRRPLKDGDRVADLETTSRAAGGKLLDFENSPHR